MELYHHIPGPGNLVHKCETKHSCKITPTTLPHPHYMKLPQHINQNWPDCLVVGGGGGQNRHGWGMVKKKKKDTPRPPAALTLPLRLATMCFGQK